MTRPTLPIRIALLLGTLVLAFAVAGCAGVRRLVTAKIEIKSETNQVSVVQPKDTTIDRLIFDPAKGGLTLEGYASAGNAEAIASARAQAEAQAQMFGAAVGLIDQLTAAFARAQGIPMAPVEAVSPMPAGASQVIRPPPSGMKWILGTNGLLVLALKDDPSALKFETP